MNIAIDFLLLLGCCVIAVVCGCRLDKMHKSTRTVFRIKYAALLGGALAAGFAPLLFPDYPRMGGLVFMVSVVFYIVSGYPAWRTKPPEYTESGRMPLDPFDPADMLMLSDKWMRKNRK